MHCPACNAEVIYFFGKTIKNRQRFVCNSCGREFAPGSTSELTRCAQ